MLEVGKSVEGKTVTFEVNGRVDASTAGELKDEVFSSLEGMKTVVFDFAGLDYISSAGLRVLLSTMKTMAKPGSVIVRNAASEIKEILDVTSLNDFIVIE